MKSFSGRAGVEGHGMDGLLRVPLNFLRPKCQTVPLIQTQGHVTLSVSQQWGKKTRQCQSGKLLVLMTSAGVLQLFLFSFLFYPLILQQATQER